MAKEAPLLARRWIGSRVGQTTFAVGVLLACAESGDLAPIGKKKSGTTGGATSSGGASTSASGGIVGDGGTTGEGGEAAGGTSGKGGTGGRSATDTGGRSTTGGTKATGGSAVAGSSSAVAGSAGRTAGGGTLAAAGTTTKGGSVSGGVAGATGAVEFPCSAANSEVVKAETEFLATVDECYVFTKPAAGTFQIGNWSGLSMTMQIQDSKKIFPDVDVKSGAWTAVSGVATGEVYLYVSETSSSPSARIKINSFQ